MRFDRIIRSSFLALLCFASSPLQQGVSQDPAEPSIPRDFEEINSRPIRGTAESKALPSKVLGRKATCFVYRTVARDSGSGTPESPVILIWLHGLFEDHATPSRWALPHCLDDAVSAGKLPPAVLIAPEGGLGLWLDGRVKRDHHRRFLLDDVLLDWRKELGLDTKARPILLGTGTGAAQALALGLSEPARFAGILAFGPVFPGSDPKAWSSVESALMSHPTLAEPLQESTGLPAETAIWQRFHPKTQLESLSKDPPPGGWPPLSITRVPEDPLLLVKTFDPLLERIQERGIPHRVVVAKGRLGGDHIWEYLPSSLAFVLAEHETKGGATPPKTGQAPHQGDHR